MRKIGLCFILLALATLLFSQQQEEKKYKLMEFRNANINSVLNYISDITGMTIITHPDLKGNVTIINKEDLTQDQIIEIIYSTLRDLGFTMERQNNILTVVPLSQERIKTEIRTDEDISKLPDGAQIITYIITLKYVNAESVINNIRPFMSKYGNVSINNKMNKIILTDSASNVKKVFQVIKELDKQGTLQGKETEIIYLKHISIDKMEGIILGGFYDLKIIDFTSKRCPERADFEADQNGGSECFYRCRQQGRNRECEKIHRKNRYQY
jgi:type II secretory pathway component GspD/PulD (secretin)